MCRFGQVFLPSRRREKMVVSKCNKLILRKEFIYYAFLLVNSLKHQDLLLDPQ